MLPCMWRIVAFAIVIEQAPVESAKPPSPVSGLCLSGQLREGHELKLSFRTAAHARAGNGNVMVTTCSSQRTHGLVKPASPAHLPPRATPRTNAEIISATVVHCVQV